MTAFGFQAWVVTRYQDAADVLEDDRFSNDISSKMRWLPRFTRPLVHNMLNRDPPDHTRLRKLVSRAFTASRVETLRARVETVCDGLLPAGGARDGFDLVSGYALPIPLTVISEMLGIPEPDRRRFQMLTRGAFKLGAPATIADVTITLPYAWLLIRFLRRLFAERRRHPADDLLSALVEAEEDGDRLDEGELLGMAVLLLLAGYETTVGLIAGGALALLEHPEERARFQEDPSVRASAVEELLRFTSPVELTPPRLAREEVRIGSVQIAAGEMVSVGIGSANRDESEFEAPDELDLARNPNRHLGFGRGRHFCLGASLARMEVGIALATLFRRFPGVRLARPAASLRWRQVVPLRALEELPVTLAP